MGEAWVEAGQSAPEDGVSWESAGPTLWKQVAAQVPGLHETHGFMLAPTLPEVTRDSCVLRRMPAEAFVMKIERKALTYSGCPRNAMLLRRRERHANRYQLRL